MDDETVDPFNAVFGHEPLTSQGAQAMSTPQVPAAPAPVTPASMGAPMTAGVGAPAAPSAAAAGNVTAPGQAPPVAPPAPAVPGAPVAQKPPPNPYVDAISKMMGKAGGGLMNMQHPAIQFQTPQIGVPGIPATSVSDRRLKMNVSPAKRQLSSFLDALAAAQGWRRG